MPAQKRIAPSRVEALLAELRSLSGQKDRSSMARAGIKIDGSFGVSVYTIREMAKRLGRDHRLANELWATKQREARLLACFVDEPTQVSEAQMEGWASEFDSWDICDQATTSLFDQTPFAWRKARQWARREEEWVRRAGFALMAGLAVHDKAAPDRDFEKLYTLIERGAFDQRNFVYKAVSWALRNVGKRNLKLNASAIACAEALRARANEQAGGKRGGGLATRAARWVAGDVERELRSQKVQARLASK